jgi:hypothetical protein
MSSPVTITVQSPDLAKLAAELADASPELRKEFGKAMRKVAKDVVAKEKEAVLGLSSNAKHTQRQTATFAANALRGRKSVSLNALTAAIEHAGLRRSIANSIGAIIRYQGNDVGVRVRARSSKMPKGMERLPQLTNRGRWAHPIMGRGGNTVVQTVNPPGWWWKARDEARDQAIADFNLVLKSYAQKLARFKAGY